MNTIDSTYNDLGLALQRNGAKDQSLGQDDFLMLMTAQLQNQDPMKPMENGEFLSQIAQFSTVSGIQDMQASIADLAASLTSDQTLQAATLVGRNVLVPSEEGYLPADESMQAAAYLPYSGELSVDVVDASGQLVRNLDLGTQSAGIARFSWDGLDNAGNRLPEGSYSLRARVTQGSSQESIPTLAVGQVQSVALGSTGLTLDLRGLAPTALADVQQIL
ncbi:MAG: flagellar hook assembly protein FlgD [Nevskiales bacterium]|nr:flagellar hook assembly protein FlgD [Nevskiales bacterium]